MLSVFCFVWFVDDMFFSYTNLSLVQNESLNNNSLTLQFVFSVVAITNCDRLVAAEKTVRLTLT